MTSKFPVLNDNSWMLGAGVRGVELLVGWGVRIMGFTLSYPLPPGTLFTSCLVEEAKNGPGGRNENWPNALEKSFKMGFYLLLTSWQPGSTSFTLRRGEKLICGVEWNYSQGNPKDLEQHFFFWIGFQTVDLIWRACISSLTRHTVLCKSLNCN